MSLNNNLSIIVQPSVGTAPNQVSTGTSSGTGLSYDVSSLDVVSSVPLDQQIIVTSGTTVLNAGTDYYSDGNGNIIIDSQYAQAGDNITFARNISLETFYDDFSDLGAAPSGPSKRRDEQVLYALQDVEERLANFESGDIEVELDETRIVASNVTFGPGDIGFFDNNGILITSEANGTGIGFAINYAEALSNPLLIDGVESLVDNYLIENPVVPPVDSVAGKTGAVTLVAADLGDFDSAVDARIPAIPTAVSSLTNDAGYVTDAVVIPISQVTGLNAELAKVPPAGGTTGQVLKKSSDTDYDYAWAEDTGGGSTGGVSLLQEVGNVSFTDLSDGDFLYWNLAANEWQNQTLELTTSDLSDFNTALANFIQGGLNVSNFVNDANYATTTELTTAVDGITYSSLNGPTLLSQFSNDLDFQTETEVSTSLTDGLATKFDAVSGTPSAGDVVEWSGAEAIWAAPSAASGTAIEFWQGHFGLCQDFDTAHSPPQDPVLPPTQLTNASIGTYSTGVGDVPTFTITSDGYYKISITFHFFNQGTAPMTRQFEVKQNGTTIEKAGTVDYALGSIGVAETVKTSIYVQGSANDVITLTGDSGPGIWIIEKVG